MPPLRRPLRDGDRVSVLGVDAFNPDYLKEHHPADWHRIRFDATVLGFAEYSKKWRLEFDDGEVWHGVRNKIQFVSRPAEEEGEQSKQPPKPPKKGKGKATVPAPQVVAVESSDEEQAAEKPKAPTGAAFDSSDAEPNTDEEMPQLDEDDDSEAVKKLPTQATMEAWKRDDSYGFDQRAAAGFDSEQGPQMRELPGYDEVGLFKFALHFLPRGFIKELAEEMTKVGQVKYNEGIKNYYHWEVSEEDVLQWIGVWLYMLAFPQPGERSLFWREPVGGFGPRHRLADWLALAENGNKGQTWFTLMLACLELPKKPGASSYI